MIYLIIPKTRLMFSNKNAAIRGLGHPLLCLKIHLMLQVRLCPLRGESFLLRSLQSIDKNSWRSFVGDIVYVIPRVRSDSTIRTDQKGTSECAESIMRLAAAGSSVSFRVVVTV